MKMTRFKNSIPKLVAVLALLLGFAAYRIIQSILDFVLTSVMPLKTLNTFDEVFMYDDTGARANASFLVKMKRLKYENYQKWFKEKFFGNYSWAKVKVV